jgi:HK97 gp10 family phage protein
MMAAEIIHGLGELTANFKKLSADITQKTAFQMVVAAGGVLRKEAKALAQAQGLRKTGALIKNIAIKREKGTPPGTVQYNLGVRHGKDLGNGKKVIKYLARSKRNGRIITKRKNDPFYWHFLEFGTKHIRASHYIEGALANRRTEAIHAMEVKLQQVLDKAGKA